MPTTLKSPQNARRGNTHEQFGWNIPTHVVGYALVIALFLVSLVFGPPTMLSGKADLGRGPATEHTD